MSVQHSPEFPEQPVQALEQEAQPTPLQARWAELKDSHMWARLPGAAGAMILAAFWEPNL